jgi:hypothetical protein
MDARDVATRVFVSGASVMCATTVTNPLDVIKVRLQTAAHATTSSTAAADGAIATAMRAVEREGVSVFWRGLGPSLTRAGLYGGLRLGLYEPTLELAARALEGGDDDARGREDLKRRTSVGTKLVAGACSGAFAAALLNPTELLKTRMMATPTSGSVGAKPSAIRLLTDAARTDGVLSLWRGCSLAMTRSAVLTASQVATYGEAKRAWLSLGVGAQDGFQTHFIVSMLTGVVTTAATNPVDMVKTQMFIARGSGITAFGTLRRVLATHGPMGLFKGFSANYVRLGPQTVVTFCVGEFLRERFGLDAL